MTAEQILARLRALGNPANREGMARYGINVDRALGISLPTLRGLAREIGRSHELALDLWASGLHEARVLACLVEDPAAMSPEQMDAWTADFDSWDLCDVCCNSLFRRMPGVWDKAAEYAHREEEFVRRTGFSLMAVLAVHDKQACDERFLALLELVRGAAEDERNFVKKAVNWALRQIGKRNLRLHQAALTLAEELSQSPVRSARWIGRDAARELASPAVQERLRRKG